VFAREHLDAPLVRTGPVPAALAARVARGEPVAAVAR
jgi:hypothetical protein